MPPEGSPAELEPPFDNYPETKPSGKSENPKGDGAEGAGDKEKSDRSKNEKQERGKPVAADRSSPVEPEPPSGSPEASFETDDPTTANAPKDGGAKDVSGEGARESSRPADDAKNGRHEEGRRTESDGHREEGRRPADSSDDEASLFGSDEEEEGRTKMPNGRRGGQRTARGRAKEVRSSSGTHSSSHNRKPKMQKSRRTTMLPSSAAMARRRRRKPHRPPIAPGPGGASRVSLARKNPSGALQLAPNNPGTPRLALKSPGFLHSIPPLPRRDPPSRREARSPASWGRYPPPRGKDTARCPRRWRSSPE